MQMPNFYHDSFIYFYICPKIKSNILKSGSCAFHSFMQILFLCIYRLWGLQYIFGNFALIDFNLPLYQWANKSKVEKY